MRIAKAAVARANRALRILAGICEGGRELNATECRRYDDCFEMGDGTAVVCEIMRQAESDLNILEMLQRYPACQWVDLAGWRETYRKALVASGGSVEGRGLNEPAAVAKQK